MADGNVHERDVHVPSDRGAPDGCSDTDSDAPSDAVDLAVSAADIDLAEDPFADCAFDDEDAADAEATARLARRLATARATHPAAHIAATTAARSSAPSALVAAVDTLQCSVLADGWNSASATNAAQVLAKHTLDKTAGISSADAVALLLEAGDVATTALPFAIAAAAYDDWLLLRLGTARTTPECLSPGARAAWHTLLAAALTVAAQNNHTGAPSSSHGNGGEHAHQADRATTTVSSVTLELLALTVATRCRHRTCVTNASDASVECPLPSAVTGVLRTLSVRAQAELCRRVALAAQDDAGDAAAVALALGLSLVVEAPPSLATPADVAAAGEVGVGSATGTERRLKFNALMQRMTLGIRGVWMLLPRQRPASMCAYPTKLRRARLQRCRKLKAVATGKRAARPTVQQANREVAALMLGTDLSFLGDVLDHGLRQGTLDFAAAAEGYDCSLHPAELFQASRNAWTCYALQLLYGRVGLNDGITGYSLLYPYSDNHLDDPKLAPVAKRDFQRRFRHWLAGQGLKAEEKSIAARESAVKKADGPTTAVAAVEAQKGEEDGSGVQPTASDTIAASVFEDLTPQGDSERKVWDQVRLIQRRFPLPEHAPVAHALVAILDAQTASLRQHTLPGAPAPPLALLEDITFYKGGTSVLADAFLAPVEPLSVGLQAFAFAFGVALQLVDDIQVRFACSNTRQGEEDGKKKR